MPTFASSIAQKKRYGIEGKTVMFAAVDGALVALLGVSDPIKDSAREAMQQLHPMACAS